MRLTAVLILALATTQAGAATIYKCKDDRGRPVFSQQPCGDKAETLEVNAKSVVTSDRAGDDWASVRNGLRRDEVETDISRVQRRIEFYQDEMDRKLHKLRAQKRRAANDLIGATWEQSISTEMQSVTDRYRNLIEQERYKLDRLYDELRSL